MFLSLGPSYGQSSKALFCLSDSCSSTHGLNMDTDTQVGLCGENGGSVYRCWPTWKLMLLVPNFLPLNFFWFSSSSDYPHWSYNGHLLNIALLYVLLDFRNFSLFVIHSGKHFQLRVIFFLSLFCYSFLSFFRDSWWIRRAIIYL